MAGYGLWRWLGLDELSLTPLLTQPWLPAWVAAALSRVPPSLPSWLMLTIAMLGPLTGSLLTAIVFATAAAALTGVRPAAYDTFSPTWPPPIDVFLLAAPALVGYLLACRAARIGRRPVTAKVASRTSASVLLRAWWRAGVLTGPAVSLALAASLAVAALWVGRQARMKWTVASPVGDTALVLVVALAAWVIVVLIRQIVSDLMEMILSDAARGQRVTAGLWTSFWLRQRRSIDATALVLRSFAGGDATRRVRAGLGRALVCLLVAGGAIWGRSWLASTKPEVLAVAEAWLIKLARAADPAVTEASDWVRNVLRYLASILAFGGGFGS